MIDNHHKNIKHNLVQLCKSCHSKVTNKELIVTGWIETSNGKKLNWSECTKKMTKKKFSEGQIQIINDIKNKYQSVSQDVLISKLDLEHNIKISKTTLNKILNNNY